MKRRIKQGANKLLNIIGHELVESARLESYSKQIEAYMHEVEDYRNISVPSMVSAALFYASASDAERRIIAPHLIFSKAQLAQDIFALAASGSEEPKYFVEFGAADGVFLSNTYLLEKRLGWEGILIEPARVWHEKLKSSRKCHIDFRCITSVSGEECDFLEVRPSSSIDYSGPELSSLARYADNGDWASDIRAQCSVSYKVTSITLDDLLDEYAAPQEIQFLSIDTEGSEFDILSSFSFARTIRSICVEHNHNEAQREKIRQLLGSKGYIRVHEDLSGWDDWYIMKP
jgi:FkbM family methyltransferase